MTDDDATGAEGAAAPLRGALEGMRVLDFTSIVLGPLAMRMLGDYGPDEIADIYRSGDAVAASKAGPGVPEATSV